MLRLRWDDGYGERCACVDGECWVCEFAEQEEAMEEGAERGEDEDEEA